MNIDQSELFEKFDPPAGGAERLRARLQTETSRPLVLPARLGLAAVAASLLLMVILFAPRPETPDDAATASDLYDAPAFDRLLGREFQAVALRVTLNEEQMRAVALADENPKVRLYELRPDN